MHTAPTHNNTNIAARHCDAGRLPYGVWFCQPAGDDLRLLERGISTEAVRQLAGDLRIPPATLRQWLGVPRARGTKSRIGCLSRSQAESLLGLGKLVGHAQMLVATCGSASGFDAAHWLGQWLCQRLPMVGHRLPYELITTAAGRELLREALERAKASVYG